MEFFRTFLESIYSPPFYADAPRSRLGSGLGYFFVLIALLTVVKTAVLVVPELIKVTPAMQRFVDDVGTSFPEGLTLTVHSGKVTTNVREPYFIPVTAATASSLADEKNLVVIDTIRPVTAEQFNAYGAFIWLTKDGIAVRQSTTGEFRFYPLSQVGDFVLNRQKVNDAVDAVRPYVALVAPILGFFALIGIYLAYMFRLLYLFVLALAIMLLLRLLGQSRSYGESYKIGLYAMTTALLVELLLAAFYPYLHYDGFPFMFGVIALVSIVVNTVGTSTSDSRGWVA